MSESSQFGFENYFKICSDIQLTKICRLFFNLHVNSVIVTKPYQTIAEKFGGICDWQPTERVSSRESQSGCFQTFQHHLLEKGHVFFLSVALVFSFILVQVERC